MINLQLITLTGSHIDEDIFELSVPTTAGTIVINEGHAPLLGAVSPGVLTVTRTKNSSDHEQLGVYNGTIEVLNNVIRVLVDEVDAPESVNREEAEAALKRAQTLKENAKDSISLADAQALMDRQAVRLQLADLKKSNKNSKKRF